jgi:hypothetical protein
MGKSTWRPECVVLVVEGGDGISKDVVRCWDYARKSSRGDGFDDKVCAEGRFVQLNLRHTSKGCLDDGW